MITDSAGRAEKTAGATSAPEPPALSPAPPQPLAAPALTSRPALSGEALADRLRAAVAHTTPPSSDHDPERDRDLYQPPLRDAGVLAAFHEDDGRLFLTKRAATMRHHPGQIALPGGKVDPCDPDVTAAALREAHEEIGLHTDQVEVIGTLPVHHTVTRFRITPLIAIIRGPFTPLPEPGEVAEVFTLPFAHVTDAANYRLERRDWQGTPRAYPVAPLGPYYLWGATARILMGLAERLRS